MDVNIPVCASCRIDYPQTWIPVIAIHRCSRPLRQHWAVEKAMTGYPMQEIAEHISGCQTEYHLLWIVYPDLLSVVACTINCQVAPIRRKLHNQYVISFRQAKAIAKMRNGLWITQRLSTAPLRGTSQYKTRRLFERVVDICR